jgi:hypothetical protein
MDGERFDDMARSWAFGSRRRVLRVLLGATVGAVAGYPVLGAAVACREVGKACAAGADCCFGHCSADERGDPPAARCCLASGTRCKRDIQCCTGLCKAGECACLTVGTSCSDDGQCCTEVCAGGVCACRGEQTPCGARCCASGHRCEDGRCVAESGDAVACPACGTCRACDPDGRCDLPCEPRCAANDLCDRANRNPRFAKLAAYVTSNEFRQASEPEALVDSGEDGSSLSSSLTVRYAHRARHDAKAWLAFGLARDGTERAFAAVYDGSKVAYGLVVGETGEVERVEAEPQRRAARDGTTHVAAAGGSAQSRECQLANLVCKKGLKKTCTAAARQVARSAGICAAGLGAEPTPVSEILCALLLISYGAVCSSLLKKGCQATLAQYCCATSNDRWCTFDLECVPRGACCPNEKCRDACCRPGRVAVCDDAGGCCTERQVCPDSIEGCCAPGKRCTKDHAGQAVCCYEDELCRDGICKRYRNGELTCCGSQKRCGADVEFCCPKDNKCCGYECCPPGKKCCSFGGCCGIHEKCCEGKCCKATEVCEYNPESAGTEDRWRCVPERCARGAGTAAGDDCPVDRCDGVICNSPRVCRPSDGACVCPNTCEPPQQQNPETCACEDYCSAGWTFCPNTSSGYQCCPADSIPCACGTDNATCCNPIDACDGTRCCVPQGKSCWTFGGGYQPDICCSRQCSGGLCL